jgi:hypothetical protein
MERLSYLIAIALVIRPGAAAAQTCTPPPAGLVSWWPGEGNAIDIISGNNGTLVGNVAFSTGEVGSAFQFNGASYVSVPATPSLMPQSSITVDAWVNPSPNGSYNNYPPIIKDSGTASSPNAGYSLELGGTNAAFWVFVNGFWYFGGGVPIPLGSWTHLAGTYDGQNVLLYVNGVQTGNVAYAPGGIVPATLGLQIGHSPAVVQGDGDRFFTGGIDEADVFNRALTATEIQAIYAAGPSGKCAAISATAQLQNLISSTLITNLAANIQNQLDAKLSSALATLDALQKNSPNTATNQLQAFVNSVAADVYSGRISCGQASALIAAAQHIVSSLHQPPLVVSIPCP